MASSLWFSYFGAACRGWKYFNTFSFNCCKTMQYNFLRIRKCLNKWGLWDLSGPMKTLGSCRWYLTNIFELNWLSAIAPDSAWLHWALLIPYSAKFDSALSWTETLINALNWTYITNIQDCSPKLHVHDESRMLISLLGI